MGCVLSDHPVTTITITIVCSLDRMQLSQPRSNGTYKSIIHFNAFLTQQNVSKSAIIALLHWYGFNEKH